MRARNKAQSLKTWKVGFPEALLTKLKTIKFEKAKIIKYAGNIIPKGLILKITVYKKVINAKSTKM